MTRFRPSARKAAFLTIAVAALVFGPLTAQENLGRGRVTGSVIDESGAPVEGALVEAASLQGTAKLEAKSDRKGHFVIAGFGTGMWRFTVSKAGFQTSTTDHEIRQLRSNPPVQLVLKKLTGLAAFQASPEGQELLGKGNELFDAGRYDDAIKVFEEFAAAYPDVYQVQINIASSYAKKGDAERAEAGFRGVLDAIVRTRGSYEKDKAAAVRALSGLGELALSRKDFENGRRLFSEALALSPQDEAAAYNVGEIFFSNQEIDEAIKYFELAIQIKRGWPKPYHRLGLVYLNKGDFDKALEYLKKFLEIDPASPDAASVKGLIVEIEKVKK